MKVTNKSELMKAAWKMFCNTKNNLKAFAEEHKAEASIWKLAAKYARMQDSEFYSYC